MKRKAEDIAAAFAVLLLAVALSGGMILGRATSDLLFYACAVAQAALAALGARLATLRGGSIFAVLAFGAVLLRLGFVMQTPSLSGDIYRYI